MAQSLRLAGGIAAAERAGLVARLSALDDQLARYPAEAVELELSVEARGTRGQRLTLECSISGMVRMVAASAEWDLRAALMRVREGMRRQLDDAATRREPRNDRHLRRSVLDSDGSSHRRALAGQGVLRCPVGPSGSAGRPSHRSSR
ncbi:hypothetical protein [Geodermatophilus obscurus]|uniref:hypothetical protein n=1 Tax=Geodermatophilus obscurus TaxID=1861 RepID=UPI001AD8B9BF|nr:hypothetical protein [Geodermatophilus obscurus]